MAQGSHWNQSGRRGAALVEAGVNSSCLAMCLTAGLLLMGLRG